MKRYLVITLIILIMLSLTGCKLFDLGGWVTPDDDEFTTVVVSLDTPEKICNYMRENFEWNSSIHTYSPYQMYLANLEDWNNTGDCDDFATFGIFVANYHGYETYRIKMWWKDTGFYGLPLILPHVLGIYVEDGKLTYSNNGWYCPIFVDSFQEIVDHCESKCYPIISWKVYDYDGTLKETEWLE